MTNHRYGHSYSREEIADCAMNFHTATGIAPHAQKHHFTVLEKGLDIENRTPERTRELFLHHSDTVPTIKTGPETGVVALSVHTHDEDSGLFALDKAELFCFCSQSFIEVRTCWDEKTVGHHILHFSAEPKTFSRWAFSSLPGVVLLESGEYAPVAPGYTEPCHPLCPSADYSYGYGRSYAEFGIPELPPELVDRLTLEQADARHQERAQTSSNGMKRELFDPIPAGGRNIELTRRAGYLIGVKKMSEDQALEALLQINIECCHPPLHFNEVASIARSIARRHERNG